MATLILNAVGTAIGGPIGGAIGALAGRALDSSLIGSGHRDGPRLKELALTTSSYGQPVPRHFGTVRAGGIIIWATDLREHSEASGGGKGQPSVTTYSYSCSFAVALSSRAIERVGRIWADGNLLRGAGGDLKVPGTLRIHTGHGDQMPDPLLASALGGQCPAFRGMAYAVFEDLALSDFGNRIPALTFEIVADSGPVALADVLAPLAGAVVCDGRAPMAGLAGFSDEGGPIRSALETIGTLYPLACRDKGGALAIAPHTQSNVRALPPAARSGGEGDFGADTGVRRCRDAAPAAPIDGVRYYDPARDYLPGLQRIAASSAHGRTIEFPGSLSATDARLLATRAARRSADGRETLEWRMADLDPALLPGATVTAPGQQGLWRIARWEWRETGVELALTRLPVATGDSALASDSGAALLAPDVPNAPTLLQAFELPADGLNDPDTPHLFAALSSPAAGWRGAALYLDRGGRLAPLGGATAGRATVGTLQSPLPPSSALLFEPAAVLEIELANDSDSLSPTDMRGIAYGANRLLVSGEIVQFLDARMIGPRQWRVTGLLRGRGGTEPAAAAGHRAGTPAILLDAKLTALDPAAVPASSDTVIAAIGRGDDDAVLAPLQNAGIGRQPLSPVHPRCIGRADGGVVLSWTRRARGQWQWADAVDAPLIEQAERYLLGIGPAESPAAQWTVDSPHLALSAATMADLRRDYPGQALWVCQIGTFSRSAPLVLLTM
ncbi:phage tail protein [Tsuneonella suprasediminis]|uniref:phage tail protein n=1 Tax=Tsuneonella suprasediminis TaxID=2306996 RepID=UPI002F929149